MTHGMPEVGRTPINQAIVLRELRATRPGDAAFFRADHAVVAESGALVWTEGAELVVRHPDAHVTRQRGRWCLEA